MLKTSCSFLTNASVLSWSSAQIKRENLTEWTEQKDEMLPISSAGGNVASIYELLSTICTPLTHCASSACLFLCSPPNSVAGVWCFASSIWLLRSDPGTARCDPDPCMFLCHHRRRCQGGLAYTSRETGGHTCYFQWLFHLFFSSVYETPNGIFSVFMCRCILSTDKIS